MTTTEDRRAAAIERLDDRREFRRHLAIYLLVNAMLVIVWAATGAGYFWPIWAIGGWGVGVIAHGLTVHGDRPFSDDQIRAEMEREDRRFRGR